MVVVVEVEVVVVVVVGWEICVSFCKISYYMAESVFAMRLVNFRSVTCYTDQNFKEIKMLISEL